MERVVCDFVLTSVGLTKTFFNGSTKELEEFVKLYFLDYAKASLTIG